MWRKIKNREEGNSRRETTGDHSQTIIHIMCIFILTDGLIEGDLNYFCSNHSQKSMLLLNVQCPTYVSLNSFIFIVDILHSQLGYDVMGSRRQSKCPIFANDKPAWWISSWLPDYRLHAYGKWPSCYRLIRWKSSMPCHTQAYISQGKFILWIFTSPSSSSLQICSKRQ